MRIFQSDTDRIQGNDPANLPGFLGPLHDEYRIQGYKNHTRLLVGCLAGYVIERRPVLSASQRLVMGGVFSALALLLQLFLSGYSPFMVAQALLVCWWSWAMLSAGLFWVSSYVFPWREW